RLRVVLRQCIADSLDRFFTDTWNVFQVLRREIGKLFDGRDTGSIQFLEQAWRQARHVLYRSRNSFLDLLHLALDFGTLFFFTLDVNAPADELRSKPHILPLLADGNRELTVLDHHFHDLLVPSGDRYT